MSGNYCQFYMLRFNCSVIQLRLVRTLIGTLRVHYSYRSLGLYGAPTASNIQGVETVIGTRIITCRTRSYIWSIQTGISVNCLCPFSTSRIIKIGELIMLASSQCPIYYIILVRLLKHRINRQHNIKEEYNTVPCGN